MSNNHNHINNRRDMQDRKMQKQRSPVGLPSPPPTASTVNGGGEDAWYLTRTPPSLRVDSPADSTTVCSSQQHAALHNQSSPPQTSLNQSLLPSPAASVDSPTVDAVESSSGGSDDVQSKDALQSRFRVVRAERRSRYPHFRPEQFEISRESDPRPGLRDSGLKIRVKTRGADSKPIAATIGGLVLIDDDQLFGVTAARPFKQGFSFPAPGDEVDVEMEDAPSPQTVDLTTDPPELDPVEMTLRHVSLSSCDSEDDDLFMGYALVSIRLRNTSLTLSDPFRAVMRRWEWLDIFSSGRHKMPEAQTTTLQLSTAETDKSMARDKSLTLCTTPLLAFEKAKGFVDHQAVLEGKEDTHAHVGPSDAGAFLFDDVAREPFGMMLGFSLWDAKTPPDIPRPDKAERRERHKKKKKQQQQHREERKFKESVRRRPQQPQPRPTTTATERRPGWEHLREADGDHRPAVEEKAAASGGEVVGQDGSETEVAAEYEDCVDFVYLQHVESDIRRALIEGGVLGPRRKHAKIRWLARQSWPQALDLMAAAHQTGNAGLVNMLVDSTYRGFSRG